MVEATSGTATLPEPYRVDIDGDGREDGWRVETICKSCQAGMYLDLPDEIPAEKLWGPDVTDDERGTIVQLSKPNEHALKVARSMMVCDECADALETDDRQRQQAIEFRGRLERSGLPKELRGLQWDAMDRSGDRRGVIAAGRAWTESRKGRLFLTGGVGVGKTRLAATALWDRMKGDGERAGTEAIWMPVASLMQWAFFPSLSAERQRAQRALASPVPLVLDDLGKEKPGDWARQIMFGAIDLRIQAGVPILITSNLDADDLTARLGQGFGSRLRQFHQFQLVSREGDMRTNEDALS